MNQSLQICISQHLTLTPQLQQAIKLLQLSTFDLQHEIQQLIESNPMLESIPNESKDEPNAGGTESFAESSRDFQWSSDYPGRSKSSNFNGDAETNYEQFYCTTNNLQDHLRWQLDLTVMSDIDRVIATTLIDAINDDGFLTSSIEEIHTSLNSDEHPLDLDEIEAVRHRIQQFDPVGCSAINLAETLLIQLNQHAEHSEALDLAKRIVRDDIELVGQHHYRQLLKIYQINEATLNSALDIIRHVNPRPGSLIHQGTTEYIIPDVTVKKINGCWKAFLNQNTLPKLGINAQYASLIQRADNSVDNQFLKNNLQEARWFLKSIQSRQDTLLKVAQCIVDYQQDFLELGDEAMKPLVLHNVANVLEMHESTISRVTTQKYLHTPRGLFELKYFFSSHVNTINGGECSSTAIRAVIKKLIAAESPRKPLSDNKIAQLIEKQGIYVARRTIAKYREAMGIAPSNERKSIQSDTPSQISAKSVVL